MRIAIVIDSLKMGGAQKLIVTYALAAHDFDIEPTVINLNSKIDLSVLGPLESSGVNVVTFPSRSLLDLGRLWRLIIYFRQEKFELIHTHLTHSNIIGCITGYFAKIPIVCTLHSTGHDRNQFLFYITLLEEVCLRFIANRIVAVGYSIGDAYQGRFGSRVIDVIPNGVPTTNNLEPETRQRLRREIAKDESRLVIISIGRLVQAKGYLDLLEAFASLHCNHPQPYLVLVGTGRLYDQIRNKISNLNIEDSVNCLGHRDDIAQLLSASDIYVSSSHREGLPLSVLEAMMAGLPIIGTSVGDVPQIVLPETGIIVPPQEPALLAKAIKQLIDSPEQRRSMGNTAREHAMKEHSLNVWMERLVVLYKETLNSYKGL